MSTPEEHSMSESFQSLTHSRWNCKDHVVFVPKWTGWSAPHRVQRHWSKKCPRSLPLSTTTWLHSSAHDLVVGPYS